MDVRSLDRLGRNLKAPPDMRYPSYSFPRLTPEIIHTYGLRTLRSQESRGPRLRFQFADPAQVPEGPIVDSPGFQAGDT